MKKIISVLLTVFILLCTFSLSVSAVEGETFETSNEDISLSVTLEGTEFLVSKKINMDIMVKNISDDLLFQYLNTWPSDYWWKVNGELIAEDGTVYGYPYFRVEGSGAALGSTVDRGLSSVEMAEEYIWPSECEASYRVLGNSLPTGDYKLRLWVDYTDQYDKVGSEIRTYGINTKTLELVVDIAIKDTLEPTTEPMTTLPLDLPEQTTVSTTQPLESPDEPTQNAPTQSTELDVVHPTAVVPTQPTELDVVHPTATAPSGFYNNETVPNPPTDAGSIPAISLALIGASLLIVCSKKKK